MGEPNINVEYLKFNKPDSKRINVKSMRIELLEE